MELNGRKVIEHSIRVEGVDPTDYPDFCDAYIVSAEFEDGTQLSLDELEELENLYPDALSSASYEYYIDMAN